MIKMIVAFLGIFMILSFTVQGFVAVSTAEKLQFAKVLGYSLVCSTLATLIATAIVILF